MAAATRPSFVIPAQAALRMQAEASSAASSQGQSERDLLRRLAHEVAPMARAPISNFLVGSSAIAPSGNVYCGVNLEFPGLGLANSVHAEQFLWSLMIHSGERGVRAMAVNQAPCGHCRQFMKEYRDCDQVEIDVLSLDVRSRLPELLPHSFGPKDLGVTDGCMFGSHARKHYGYELDTSYSLAKKALVAMNTLSWAPYTKSHSAVAIKMLDDSVYCGAYLESAAYNPSLPPVQSAIVQLVANHQSYDHIREVVLVERGNAPVSQELATRSVIRSINKEALVAVHRVRVDSKL